MTNDSKNKAYLLGSTLGVGALAGYTFSDNKVRGVLGGAAIGALTGYLAKNKKLTAESNSLIGGINNHQRINRLKKFFNVPDSLPMNFNRQQLNNSISGF